MPPLAEPAGSVGVEVARGGVGELCRGPAGAFVGVRVAVAVAVRVPVGVRVGVGVLVGVAVAADPPPGVFVGLSPVGVGVWVAVGPVVGVSVGSGVGVSGASVRSNEASSITNVPAPLTSTINRAYAADG
jgi:hypothetical protein